MFGDLQTKLNTLLRNSKKDFPKIWDRYYKILVVFFFLLSTGWMGFIWYQSVMGERWDPVKKEQYVERNTKKITLEQHRLNEVLEAIKLRRDRFLQEHPATFDPFKSNEIQEARRLKAEEERLKELQKQRDRAQREAQARARLEAVE